MPPDLAVLIPALDAARTIGAVVAGARTLSPFVVVIDDGSRDDSATLARAAGAEVVSHPENRGKGVALSTGFEWARLRGLRRALTMDADGQHLADEARTLIAASDAEPQALIIGARKVDETEVARINLFGNRFANRWVEIACGRSIPDTQSGLRIYPIEETLALRARAQRFAFETEILIRAARAGIPIRSVWVHAYYPPPNERISHYRPFQDTVRIIFVVLRLILTGWWDRFRSGISSLSEPHS